jgi:hypothetical protein
MAALKAAFAVQNRKAGIEMDREKRPKRDRYLCRAPKMILPLVGGVFVPGKPAQD